ncbi:hypothetical protein [Metaplanococcus flavidus]|uniref:Uncharacterized protein n=1 Tax=Metaplanococcus flavidus TaxID=569883 RepID=A0ABW3L9B3_9BACL
MEQNSEDAQGSRRMPTKLAKRCRSSLKIVLLQCCALRRKDSFRAGHVYCLRSCFAEYRLSFLLSQQAQKKDAKPHPFFVSLIKDIINKMKNLS